MHLNFHDELVQVCLSWQPEYYSWLVGVRQNGTPERPRMCLCPRHECSTPSALVDSKLKVALQLLGDLGAGGRYWPLLPWATLPSSLRVRPCHLGRDLIKISSNGLYINLSPALAIPRNTYVVGARQQRHAEINTKGDRRRCTYGSYWDHPDRAQLN